MRESEAYAAGNGVWQAGGPKDFDAAGSKTGVVEAAWHAGGREFHRDSRPFPYDLSCNLAETGVFAKTTQYVGLCT